MSIRKLPAILLFISIAFTVNTRAQQSTPKQSDSRQAMPPSASEPSVFLPPTSDAKTESSVQSEDWNTLSIRPLHMYAMPPTIVERDTLPTYKRDVVRLLWRNGDPIDLFIYTPVNIAKAPAILYLYSYPSDVTRFQDAGWATRATSNGFAAIGFVSALTGERYRSRPMKEWFVSDLQEALGTSVHDVQMILDYLATRQDIDMSRIGMFGQGSGGAIAVLAAQADSRIQALDLMNPWGDWPDWLKNSRQVPDEERPAYLTPEFAAKLVNLDPIAYLPQLKVKSLRIQQVMDDAATPKAAMDRIAAAAPVPSDVARFHDSGAHFEAMHTVGVSGWLKGQLQMQSAPTVDKSQPQRVAGIGTITAKGQ